jgi:two-component system chemotaxis sensor kinase CheA
LLPVTLAFVPAFMVQSGGQRYCLDASRVADACLLEMNDDEEQAHSSSTYRWHDEELPLLSLRGLLGQPPVMSNAGKAQHLVVARCDEGPASGTAERAGRTVAIIVDGWEGYRKVLVRGLGRHASRWRGIGGAIELDDGAAALLLDLPGLLDQT